MRTVELPASSLKPAAWSPNRMDPGMVARLRASLQRFGLIVPLVVRQLADGRYEVLSGNQRLALLIELGVGTAPCVVVDLGDADARLLAQALNRIEGEDDLGLKAELVRTILTTLPQEQVLAILPETSASLQGFATLGKDEIAAHLRRMQQAQGARLKHFTVQLTAGQQEIVEQALARASRTAPIAEGNPNRRGNGRRRMNPPDAYTQRIGGLPTCLVCQGPLALKLARGRKSGKPFLMLLCPADGRHFRAFVNDQAYVRDVLARLEATP